MTDPICSRRRFCRHVFGAATATVVGSAWSRRAAAAEKAFPKGRYVDIHTHIGTIVKDEPLTAEGLLRWMDANDVAQAIVLPLVSPESFRNPVPTEVSLALTKPYRDRLVPFCSIDPRNSWISSTTAIVAQLQRYVDQGAKGFGEHKPGLPIDAPQSMRLYEACAKLRLPLLFHCDNQRNTDAPGLPGLEKVLQAFPELPMIGHGPGWWASISGAATQADLGGYPKGPVAPGGALDRLMEKYPNLYADLSAGSGAGAIRRDLQFGREFLIRRADRILFGTDYLSPGQDVPQLELYRTLDLPADVQSRIFRDNARKLLNLQPV